VIAIDEPRRAAFMVPRCAMSALLARSDFRAVILDIDGVVVDSPHFECWRDAIVRLSAGRWNALAEQPPARQPWLTPARYRQHFSGRRREDGARRAAGALGLTNGSEEFVSELCEVKHAIFLDRVKAGTFGVWADALRLLSGLRAAGMPMAAASSSKNARAILRSIDLGSAGTLLRAKSVADMFDVDVNGWDGGPGKPGPGIFQQAARLLDIEPRQAIVFEDAAAGIAGARAAGAFSVGVARHVNASELLRAGANLVVSRLDGESDMGPATVGPSDAGDYIARWTS
jgi:beta-phosphoglucomutase-like phosphatase (HAD superfamily)